MTRFVLAAVVLAACGAGGVAAQPSFDCATAKADVERAICADENLADLDRTMAALYQAALARLDAADAAALRADQRAWLAGRNAGFGTFDPKVEMEQRATMLRETYFTAHRFLGRWMNHAGSVLIKDRRGLIVSFDPSECDTAGEPREAGDSIVFTTGADGRDAENWSARITRRGPLLKVEFAPPRRGKKPKPSCQNGRTIEGIYFPAGH